MKIDPLFWKNIYDSEQSDNFLQIQSDAIDLITSILANAKNREKQGAILRQIRCDGLSLLYLFVPFIGWQIKKEQTLFFEDPDIDFGTPDHLYEMIRWADPQLADQILDFIYSSQIPLLHYITDLWSEAFDHCDTEPDYNHIEMRMFAPVD